jgi:hypothetical protein
VLRQVQVLALTPRLAVLNYDTAEAARIVVAGLITPGPAAVPPDVGPAKHDTPADSAHRGTAQHSRPPAAELNGHARDGEAACAGRPGLALRATAPGAGTAQRTGKRGNKRDADSGEDGSGDAQLITAAASILAEAARHGDRLSQAALAEKLRSQGFGIANERLRWLLAEASNLTIDHPPDRERLQHGALPAAGEPSGHQPAPPAAAGSRINGDARNQAAPQHERRPGQDIQLPGGS